MLTGKTNVKKQFKKQNIGEKLKLITVTRVHLESLLRWALTKTAAATTTELCFKAKKLLLVVVSLYMYCTYSLFVATSL